MPSLTRIHCLAVLLMLLLHVCICTCFHSHKRQVYSRAYINFKKVEDVIDFYEVFNGHIFVNEKGKFPGFSFHCLCSKPAARSVRQTSLLRRLYVLFAKLTGSCLSDQGDHFKTQGLSTRHLWNMLPINVCQNLDPRRMPGRVLS
jgi:hypothetical protein